MTKAAEKAARAKRLREDEAFQEFAQEVLEDQTAVFLRTSSTPEDREHAHAMVRAIEAIKAKVKTAETDHRFEQKRKKGQHRGSD